MDGKSDQMQHKCRSGCGYNGNPATEGLCSSCYNDMLSRGRTKTNQSELLSINSKVLPTCSTGAAETQAEVQANTSDTTAAEVVNAAETVTPESSMKSSIGRKKILPIELLLKNSSKAMKKMKNRCPVCLKKIGLTAFECRCGGIYCSYHRYSDRHNCAFDYRALGVQEISRNNPRIVAEKIKKF